MHFSERVIRIFAVFAFLSLIPSAFATLINNDSVTITGNNPDNNGSFVIQVDFMVYDGLSTTDPLGITSGELQLAFVLEHLGDDGELPALNIGRFTVFAPDKDSTEEFYTAISSVYNDGVIGGGKAPTIMVTELPEGGIGANRAKFLFFTSDGFDDEIPDFGEGDISQLLVLTTATENLPYATLLELNYSRPAVDGDIEITLIPEPSSALLVGIMFTWLSLKRERKE
jgi:hypothetical protein